MANFFQKSFCFVVLTNYLCLIVLVCEPLMELRDKHVDSNLITRTLIFIIVILFQIAHALFYGFFQDNIYELYATMVTQLVVCLIIILRSIFITQWDLYSKFLLAYGIFFQFVYTIYAVPLYKAHSWTFYKKAGADPHVRDNYRGYLRVFALLKLDFMVSIINILLYHNDRIPWLIAFYLITGVSSVLLFNLGYFAFIQEKGSFVIAFWSLSWIMIASFGVGMYQLFALEHLSVVDMETLALGHDNNVFSFSYVLSGIVVVTMRVLLLVQSVRVFNHFGEGIPNLDKHEVGSRKEEVVELDEGKVGYSMVPTSTRWLTVDDVITNTMMQQKKRTVYY